jgi:hypothetical protein
MVYVSRQNGIINGVYNKIQVGYAEEQLADNNAEVVAFFNPPLTALENQIESEKADLPTWAQVVTAIDNAFPDPAQANIIKKIARPVYTQLKRTVD